MKKFETLVGSDAAGTLKDLPLDEAGLGQEGAAASNGAVVRSDLPLFKTDDGGVELADAVSYTHLTLPTILPV